MFLPPRSRLPMRDQPVVAKECQPTTEYEQIFKSMQTISRNSELSKEARACSADHSGRPQARPFLLWKRNLATPTLAMPRNLRAWQHPQR
eukprot:7250736-Lingulodinium_polyedra.AAC.1